MLSINFNHVYKIQYTISPFDQQRLDIQFKDWFWCIKIEVLDRTGVGWINLKPICIRRDQQFSWICLETDF